MRAAFGKKVSTANKGWNQWKIVIHAKAFSAT